MEWFFGWREAAPPDSPAAAKTAIFAKSRRDTKEPVLSTHRYVCCGWKEPTSSKDLHLPYFLHKIIFMQSTSPSSQSATLAERALQQLRRDVLQGIHPPGEKLKLEVLQEQYGFSSSPLREALNRLAQEGLVRSDERRGFRAAPMSAEDIGDITHMRLMLDLPALREAITNGDDAWGGELLASLHRLESLESRLPDGPAVLDEEWSRRHREFHMALLSACPSPRQLTWSASLFDQAERYRYLSARHRQGSRRKHDEHHRLMQAALQRDADTACALLRAHIEETERNVLVALCKMNAPLSA